MANRNPPGYRSPSEKKLQNYSVRLKPETRAAWKEAAARAGMSQAQATEYVFRNFAREMGIDLAPAPNQPKGPKPLTRPIVPPLDNC